MTRAQTVLLVTKDHLTRNITCAALSKYGYDVLAAECAREAATILLCESSVDVLVIDLDLAAAKRGVGVAGLARQVNPAIDLIYTSRVPHRLPPAAQAENALLLRDPYHPHQLAGIIAMRSKTHPDSPRARRRQVQDERLRRSSVSRSPRGHLTPL